MFGQNAPPFYSVLGSSGSSPTPPINYIGAIPQLNFATILNTGGFLGNSPATGTVLADGVSYDGSAWTAKDTGAVALQMNGALPGIILYANSGLTPGVVYGPTAALTWLGPGNPWTFTDKIDVASLPAADATNAGILTGPGVNQTVGGGTRTWVTTHTDGTAETLVTFRLDEDTSSKLEIVNFTTTNAVFIPLIKGTQSGTNVALGMRGIATTDSGATEVLYYDVQTAAAGALATRPIAGWRNNNTTQMQLSAAGGLSISGGTAPGLTVGASATKITKVVVYSQTITPASVAANTTAEQTFTVTGLTTADKVTVNPGAAPTAGTGIVGVRVSAADTLAVTYSNNTAGALTPVSSTCLILATRS